MDLKPPYQELGITGATPIYSDGIMPFLEVQGLAYKAKYATFNRVTFDSLVHFNETNISIGQQYSDCTFKEPLVYTNLVANGYDSTLNSDSQSLVFKGCTFEEIVQFKGKKSSIERSLVFENCEFKKGIEIESINIEIESLHFNCCVVHKKLDIFEARIKSELGFSSNSVNCFVRVENLIGSILAITEANVFSDHFHMRYSQLERGIIINNGTFKEEVNINCNQTRNEGLVIIGASFEKAVFVRFHSGKHKPERGINRFYLASAKYSNGIYIDGTEDLFADYPIVDELEIDCSPDQKGNIIFRSIHLGLLAIKGYNTSSNISLEHLFINQIRIKAFINSSGFMLSGVKASHEIWFRDYQRKLKRENALFIDDSNFGKAQFFQTDFGSFETTIFHNNILTDISTSLVKWFSPSQLETIIESNNKKVLEEAIKSNDKLRIEIARKTLISSYRSRQEIFRQLKYVYQKQGDIPASLEFRRHELDFHRKAISVKRPRKWEEYLVLWSNQTNDFGQNWWRPVWMAATFNLFFYICVVVSHSEKLTYLPSIDWVNVKTTLSELWNYLYVYWQMFNPAGLIDRMFKQIDGKTPDLQNAVFFWIILSKISMAYFIYQTIAAFRRFSR